jgi:2-phosphosulfolactate phosphatase
MMRVEVVPLPSELRPEHLRDRCVVVFDVLRATTSMVAALASGAERIVVFDSLDAARHAAAQPQDPASARLLCGEHRCLKPPGFDLGNSPGGFAHELVAGKSIYMSTTNGTRAIVAARSAGALYAAALVNAAATAAHLAALGRDVTLLCAGTEGQPAPEDMIGAGAAGKALDMITSVKFLGHATRWSLQMFHAARDHLEASLRDTQGGRNIIGAGLWSDIDFAARLNVFDLVARISNDDPPVVAVAVAVAMPLRAQSDPPPRA